MYMVIFAGPQGIVGPQKNCPSISRAIEELLRVKESANFRQTYIESLRVYLTQFSKGRSERRIDEFTTEDIDNWFVSRNEAPATMASNLGRLSSLFGFCERRRWIFENPCDFMERVRLEAKPPQILTVAEADRLVRHCATNERRILAYVALGLFAGLRPGELQNLKWDAVDLVNGRLRVDAAITKVRRMRWVKLPANCIAWLKSCPRRRGRVAPSHSTLRRAIRRVRNVMKWKAWPQDLLRHTAASYLVAIHEEVNKVALMLGNSAKVLLSVYHQLVLDDDARAFFAIQPTNEKGVIA
jgi:integrase